MSFDVSKMVWGKCFSAKNVSDVALGKQLVNRKVNGVKSYLKCNGNYVRKNKEDSSFKFVNTSKYQSVVDEWQDYFSYAYTSSGLNSLDREVVIIDNDGNDFGVSTLNLLDKTPIIYNYQRIKPNGHSQTAILIDKIRIKHSVTMKRHVERQSYIFKENEWNFVKKWGSFLKKNEIICSKKINENTLIDINRLYIITVRLLNNNFSGDLGFTGYCMQNPYSLSDGGITTWYNDEHRYSLGTLFCLALQHAINKNFDFSKRKTNCIGGFSNSSTDYIIVEHEDEGKVNEMLVNLSTKMQTAYAKSIDCKIFKFVGSLKNFTFRKGKKLSYAYAITSILGRTDITGDYDVASIFEHTKNSLDYINKHHNPMLMGYTKEQIELSNKVKKVKCLRKWFAINALKEQGINNVQISKKLGIPRSTVIRLGKLTFDDFDVESLKESLCCIKKYQDLYAFLIKVIEHNQNEKVA